MSWISGHWEHCGNLRGKPWSGEGRRWVLGEFHTEFEGSVRRLMDVALCSRMVTAAAGMSGEGGWPRICIFGTQPPT